MVMKARTVNMTKDDTINLICRNYFYFFTKIELRTIIMPILTIRQKRHWYEPKLPHAVFLNGFYAGTLKDDQLQGDQKRYYKIVTIVG